MVAAEELVAPARGRAPIGDTGYDSNDLLTAVRANGHELRLRLPIARPQTPAITISASTVRLSDLDGRRDIGSRLPSSIQPSSNTGVTGSERSDFAGTNSIRLVRQSPIDLTQQLRSTSGPG